MKFARPATFDVRRLGVDKDGAVTHDGTRLRVQMGSTRKPLAVARVVPRGGKATVHLSLSDPNAVALLEGVRAAAGAACEERGLENRPCRVLVEGSPPSVQVELTEDTRLFEMRKEEGKNVTSALSAGNLPALGSGAVLGVEMRVVFSKSRRYKAFVWLFAKQLVKVPRRSEEMVLELPESDYSADAALERYEQRFLGDVEGAPDAASMFGDPLDDDGQSTLMPSAAPKERSESSAVEEGEEESEEEEEEEEESSN